VTAVRKKPRALLPDLRKFARDQSCVRCGINDGTTVLAHYCGIRQHAYGKGMGVKGNDAVGAHLCRRCHEHFDHYAFTDVGDWRTTHSEDFLHCCALTWIRIIAHVEAA
jgi:hypothetical protein